MDPEQMLTMEEARKFLRISQNTLNALMDDGSIPVYWLGKRRRFFIEDLRNAYQPDRKVRK